MKKRTPRWVGFRRRLLPLGLSVLILWAVAVTAGSDTVGSAVASLRTQVASPLTALRWELGDVWESDSLSPATVLTIGESPLLLSAREEVAKLWSYDPAENSTTGESSTTPVTETPVEPEQSTDNGVPARTLVPGDAADYTVSGKVYISNSTNYKLEIQSLTEPFDATLTDESPQILIIHTHGSEAYTPPKGESYVSTGNYRTADSRYSVIRVGDEMADVFGAAGISVLHDRTRYDYPSYNDAYDRSLSAIKTYLAEYPSIHFILDIHRDAIEDSDGNEYKVISQLDDGTSAAQMTIVVGTDGSGLPDDHWKENLKLAVAIQQDILQSDPTLMRPILLRNSRYNQQATTGSLLVEMGAAGNSPDEAVAAGRLFAQHMVEVLQDKSK